MNQRSQAGRTVFSFVCDQLVDLPTAWPRALSHARSVQDLRAGSAGPSSNSLIGLASAHLSSHSLLQEVHNPILCPVGIFSVVCPVKEPAMAPVARRDHPNLQVALNQRHGKHGVGNKGIILCCDDEGGDVNGIEHTACPCLIVVVGSAGVSPVRSCVAVVEFTEKAMPFESSKIPLAREELRFPPQAPFKLGQENDCDKSSSVVLPRLWHIESDR